MKATATYAHGVDAGAVRTVLATVRPADWLMVASLLLLAWFEIWVEPIFQTGMPGPRLPLTLFSAVALTPLVARKTFPLAALIVMCLGMLAVGVVGDAESVDVRAAARSARRHILGGRPRQPAKRPHRGHSRGLRHRGVPVPHLRGKDAGRRPRADAVPRCRMVRRQGGASPTTAGGEAAEHTALLARTHRLELHAAVAAERTRIARELHDVVAHAISTMGIQAGAARRTLAPGQDAQHQALLDVERLGREALDEMQRMLGVLRTDEDDQGIGPLPDLTQVHAGRRRS
jgi:signal transduction histidine kinase